MRVGVFVESAPDTGGGFQQALSTAVLLHRAGLGQHTAVFFAASIHTQKRLAQEGIEAIRFRQGLFSHLDRMSGSWLGHALFWRLRKLGLPRLGRHLDALLRDHRVDVALFNEAYGSCRRISGHPFLITVWDVDHRDWPELPEARGRVFELREAVLQSLLPRAIGVIVNSSGGARRIAELYNISPDRIVEIPILPSLAVRDYAAGRGTTSAAAARVKYGLREPYIYYPAYYLPQKNHLYLLEALVELERRHGVLVHAVFSGGGSLEHLETIKRQIGACGLQDRVHFLGWVPDSDVPALYEGAVALVMPSYCGPTNIPPIEAALLRRPVICSDLPGSREWLGDAATYCDLSDPGQLADALHALLQSPRQNSTEVEQRSSFAPERMAAELVLFLDRQANLRRRWTWPERHDPIS